MQSCIIDLVLLLVLPPLPHLSDNAFKENQQKALPLSIILLSEMSNPKCIRMLLL